MASCCSASFPAGWVFDQRGDGRGVRVSVRVDAGFLVLSTWKSVVCVATVRLLPDEGARLVSNIADGLARLAARPDAEDEDHLNQRVARLEARLAAVERSDGSSSTRDEGRSAGSVQPAAQPTGVSAGITRTKPEPYRCSTASSCSRLAATTPSSTTC